MQVEPARTLPVQVFRSVGYDSDNLNFTRCGSGGVEVGGVSVSSQHTNSMLSSDSGGDSGGRSGVGGDSKSAGGGGGSRGMALGTPHTGHRNLTGGPLAVSSVPSPQPVPPASSEPVEATGTAPLQGQKITENGNTQTSPGLQRRSETVPPPTPATTATPTATTTTSQHNMDNAGDKAAFYTMADNTTNSDDNNNNSNPSGSSNDGSQTPTTPTTAGNAGSTDTAVGPIRSLRVRGQRKFLPEKTRHKRQALQDMTRPLKQWLLRHRDNPYPSKAEKLELVAQSQMTLTQVSNWFANARRRLKNTVKQPDLTWASRIKLYNSCVEGNAELLSDDSCPDSNDDMMEHRQSETFHDDLTDSLTSSSRTATPDVTAAALGNRDACSNLNHGSNGNMSSSSSSLSLNNNHSHHSYHPHSLSSSSSSSSPHPQGPGTQYAGLEETCASFHKYKHSILHRYLSDAHQHALILDEDSVAKSRDRHHSSSTGSRDFEELSTSSVSSPAHETHHDHLDDFSEEFETMALRRRTSDVSSVAEDEDMYWKEIGAALALTSLARGRINT